MMMAAIVRELVSAGVTGDALVTAIERIEGAMIPQKSAGAIRTQRWRERHQASQNVTCDTKETSPIPPKENTSSLSTLPFSNASLGSSESSEPRVACAVPPWPADYRERFWALFPNKVGKGSALRKLERWAKSKSVTFEIVMAGLERYVAKADDRPWCNPETWINQERWMDEPAMPVGAKIQPRTLSEQHSEEWRDGLRQLGVLGRSAGESGLGGRETLRLLPPAKPSG